MTSTALAADTVLPGTASASGIASHLAADVTYERIAGAIAAVTVHGAQVHVHWKNPHTGAPMGESTALMAADTSLSARLQVQARRSMVQEVLGAILRTLIAAVGGVVGGGAARVVRDVAYTASHDLQTRALAGAAYTDASRREAVVRAFAAVRPAFTWDERSARFIAR
jgi:hypothetical protein